MQAQGLQSLEELADARHSLAMHGRYGDTTIGHLTPGEMVLPRPIADDPVLKRQLFDAFQRHEINPYQYQVGHFENSINPLTGVPEFGFFKKIGKFLKKAAPVIGQVVGFAIGGPTGAAIGGGIGGAVKTGDLKGAVKGAAQGYIGGKIATGFGVQGELGIGSLWGKGGASGTQSLWKLGKAVPGSGGIGGLLQDVGASGAGALRSASAAGLPASYKGIGASWGKLSGLEKMGVGGLGLAAIGGLESGKDDSQMPAPSGELDGYLQRPLTAAALPTQYGTEGVGVGGPGGMAMGSGIAGGGTLDPATAAYLRETLGDEEYSKLMFPEFERVRMSRGGALLSPNPLTEAPARMGQPIPIHSMPDLDIGGLKEPDFLPSFGGRGGQGDVMNALKPVGDFIKGRLNVDEIKPTLQGFAQTIETKFPDNNNSMYGGGSQIIQPLMPIQEGEQPVFSPPPTELQPAVGMPDWNRMLGTARLADGGAIYELDMRGGGESSGPGNGFSDDVPAMLSDGEFVMTKQSIMGLGDGDHEKGIEYLYAMMNKNENKAQQMGVGRA